MFAKMFERLFTSGINAFLRDTLQVTSASFSIWSGGSNRIGPTIQYNTIQNNTIEHLYRALAKQVLHESALCYILNHSTRRIGGFSVLT